MSHRTDGLQTEVASMSGRAAQAEPALTTAQGVAVAPSVTAISLRDVDKTFPGVRALQGISFSVRTGSVHAIVGENGAGKSTLIKVLAGVHAPDSGAIEVFGRPVSIANPSEAQRLGISVIYQELSLVPQLTVAQNIMLAREPHVGGTGIVRRGRLRAEAQALLDRLGFRINARLLVEELSVARRQMVEIAKALGRQSRIILMDEPSSSLSAGEKEVLFDIIRNLHRHGVTVIYISHALEEVFALAETATILRDGRHVETAPISQFTRQRMVELMVGHEVGTIARPEHHEVGPEVLRVEGLSRRGAFHDISLALHAGEIIGLAGLVGAGRTEVARAIFGVDRADTGRILVQGRSIPLRSPRDALRAGIGFVPEDRKTQGILPALSVAANVTITDLPKVAPKGIIRANREIAAARRLVSMLGIRPADPQRRVRELSGGNQQKAVLAKWIHREPRILLIDEPTVGIDVGAREDVYTIIYQMAARGVAVLMISSDVDELLRLCARILVMRKGIIVDEVVPGAKMKERVLQAALGLSGETGAHAGAAESQSG